MTELSKNAARILKYLSERPDKGIPPTFREISQALSIRSTSSVFRYIEELESKGYILKDKGINRSIRLASETPVNRVPLLGKVAAGQPITAIENIEDYIPISTKVMYPVSQLFALRIQGESMINAGILDGDIVIIHQTPEAENGEIVVALIDDAATVKRFYMEEDHIRLQPENDAMEPILVDAVTILGKVVALVRNY